MSTITTNLNFNRVVIYPETGGSGRLINSISLHYGTGVALAWLPPVDGDYANGWDTTTAEFAIVKNRITSGQAEFRYTDENLDWHTPEDLPPRLKYLEELNPIKREIDNEQAIDDTEVLPSSLIVYKASVTAPTSTPPLWNETNNTWPKWKEAIETAGFEVLDEPDPTGQEVVWRNKASYARANGEYECVYDGWQTGATRYSTDNGETWTTAPPARNTAGFSLVTHIQRYNAVAGEWETEPHNPQFQGNTGENTAVLRKSTQKFVGASQDPYIQASIYLPKEWNIRNIQRGHTTHIGLQLKLREEWNQDPKLVGYIELQVDQIPMIRPDEVVAGTVPVAGRTFLFKMDNTGAMSAGLIEHANRLDNYFGDYARFTAFFKSNAFGKLKKAVAPTDTELRFSVKPVGINNGIVLFLTSGSKKEHVVVNATPSHTPQTAPQAEGGYTYWPISVSRDAAGTTSNPALAFPVNAEVSATRRGQHFEQFVVTAKRNLHAASELITHRVLDQ